MKNIFRSKCLSRIKSSALALAMAAGIVLPGVPIDAYAADALPDAPPTITIVAAGVDKKYVEVGLSINSGVKDGIANKFQLAGAVVSYDAKLMQPIEWTAREIDGVASDVSVPLPSFVRDTGTNMTQQWDSAKAIPTKGDDAFSGKTATAIVEKAADKETGYISLFANTTQLELSMAQKIPAGAELVAGADTIANAPVSEIKTPLEAPIPQAVVLRFALSNVAADATDDDILQQLTKAIDSVALVKANNDQANNGDIAGLSPIGDVNGSVYFGDVNGEKTAATVEILRAKQAKSFFSGGTGGGSSTEGIIAITAFDWDSTMLGSFIFAADNDPVKQQENADAAIAEFIARPEIDAVLKSHAGYDFLAWVKNEDSVPSSYGKRVASNSNTTLEDLILEEEHKIDFSTLTQSVAAKAAYTTNDSCQTGQGLPTSDARNVRKYTTSMDSYGRFGTGNSFSVKIKVERGNVPRSTMGALRVRMNIAGVDVFSQYTLSGADTEIIEVAPFAESATSGVLKGVSLVEWTIIDTYEYPNWVGAAERTTPTDCQSKASFTVKSVGTANNIAVWDDGTYPLFGVADGINTALEEFHAIKMASPNPDSVAPNNGNMGGVSLPVLRSIGIPTRALLAMRQSLYDAWLANEMKDLDYKALYEAASGNAYPVAP